MFIECESDDAEFGNKWPRLADQIISEAHISSIAGVKMVANIVKGYVIITVDLKGAINTPFLSELTEFETTKDGVRIILKEQNELRLPDISCALKERFGSVRVSEESRLSLFVSEATEEELNGLKVNDVPLVGDVLQMMSLLSPEGFRVGSVLSSPDRITAIWSQYSIEPKHADQLLEFHRRR